MGRYIDDIIGVWCGDRNEIIKAYHVSVIVVELLLLLSISSLIILAQPDLIVLRFLHNFVLIRLSIPG